MHAVHTAIALKMYMGHLKSIRTDFVKNAN